MGEIKDELIDYIEKEVLPQYELNEKGHGIEHIKYVTERSLRFAKEVIDINLEMVYVIASYHDIGHHINAKEHEKISAQILMEDKNLRRFFDEEQMQLMKEAIEDHRASSKHEPRTIFGKIVSSADRNTDVDTSIKRAISYQKEHYPEISKEDTIEQARLHLQKKFGKNGYAVNKIYFGKKEYEKYLKDMAEVVNDKEKFLEKGYEILNDIK